MIDLSTWPLSPLSSDWCMTSAAIEYCPYLFTKYVGSISTAAVQLYHDSRRLISVH